MKAIAEVCRNRVSLGYTIAAGLIAGAFVGYLSSSQQILQVQYELGTKFPLYFGVLAFAVGSGFIFEWADGDALRYADSVLQEPYWFSVAVPSFIFCMH